MRLTIRRKLLFAVVPGLAICLAETDLFGFYVYREDGQVKSMDIVTNACDHTQPKQR